LEQEGYGFPTNSTNDDDAASADDPRGMILWANMIVSGGTSRMGNGLQMSGKNEHTISRLLPVFPVGPLVLEAIVGD
jgi:hypothetical protein